MIAFGTGGTIGASFEGLKELFYKPNTNNVLSFPNIWDDGRENTECGFFVKPGHYLMVIFVISHSSISFFKEDTTYIIELSRN